MPLFNIISLNSGRIRTRIEAAGYDQAVEKATELLKVYVEDEYIIETAQETEQHRAQQARYWNLQTM